MTAAAGRFESFNWQRGVARDKRISIIHRFILMRLVVYRFKDGRCNPGYDQVANELGVDRKTVMRAVDVGVRFGWLAPPIRGRRANASFVFLFADQEVDQEVPSGGTSRTDQEVLPERDLLDDQEVPPSDLRSPSKRVKKSLKKEASGAKSKASRRHGHLTGKENGKREDIYAPPSVASLGGKKGRKRPAAGSEPKPEAEAESDDELRASFSEFKGVYPNKVALDSAWPDYRRAAVELGVAPDFLNNRAQVYAVTEQWRIEASSDPQAQRGFTKHAKNWLREAWYNNPLPDGAVIDENGLVTALTQEEDEEGGEEDFETRLAKFERMAGVKPW
jgi:hypothetical protein